jgi:hypothetical protein
MRSLRKSLVLVPLFALAAILVGLPADAFSKNDEREFRASLNGYNETPSINTLGTGTLKLKLNSTSIEFELKYKNLSRAPSVAHIHLGQEHTAGGVMVFFCGGGGQAACPTTTDGTVKGTIVAANVMSITAQGLNQGDLPSVLRAIRAGASYANIHTPLPSFPAGEIRGQIHPAHDDGDRNDQDGD